MSTAGTRRVPVDESVFLEWVPRGALLLYGSLFLSKVRVDLIRVLSNVDECYNLVVLGDAESLLDS